MRVVEKNSGWVVMIVFCLCSFGLRGQSGNDESPSLQLQKKSFATAMPLIHFNKSKYPALFQSAHLMSIIKESKSSVGPKPMAPYQYMEHLPIFCKLEVMADRKTRMPVRVRLGTVQYVDRLENKYQGYDWIASRR